ncbi:ABC transporter ATP-binding protein [Staphylococcus pseudoxylosus]|uniref:ABC transporter ATP-binding protein n=1 Tax=Staphylococcus pseudoxylosus TaxID=2282419 RepID=A0AAQ0MGI5_9STAP|nr:ABC transporter ATP-binding protein [Staphylococcus pseudoxylosus]MCE5002510.1 ABC transporter ATP-binding protein [Staphylococcus pseudoxylosus]RMI85510.1 ABC transporter ATP-binding protein [Staphylococcus pseudoxylosus]RQM84088.1 multidrug ABC transporter ATP-binding protein [Staphylococcus xylosus]
MENLLEIQNLNKSYKKSDFQLSDISLTLEPNEVIGIIGKNGSGKSTLINTLVGNRFKDSGEIRYFDKPITANDNQHKEHIGVVFDDLRVPNKLTIQDIDKVFSKIYKTWDSEKFFSIIKNFELPTTNEIASFSRGMRMKAALTIALSHDSKVLILDEATAGMDVSSREEVIEILEDYVAKGNGILISSHISEDIEQLATKLVFMKNGEIILEEKKDNLFNHYGILEQSKEELNIPNDILIASRVRKGSRISLINDRTAITDARPLETIDDAIKLIMRGDS